MKKVLMYSLAQKFPTQEERDAYYKAIVDYINDAGIYCEIRNGEESVTPHST